MIKETAVQKISIRPPAFSLLKKSINSLVSFMIIYQQSSYGVQMKLKYVNTHTISFDELLLFCY